MLCEDNHFCPFISLWISIKDYTVCRIFMKFGIDVLYKMSREQQFRENHLGDSNAWAGDANEFLHVLSVFLDRYECNSLHEISS